MARSANLANQVGLRIRHHVPLSVALLIDYYFRNARRAPTVAAAARSLSVHRKTLALHCARAGLPSPSALSGWARLILAAQALEDPARTTTRIAVELGFPSGSAFRSMLKRYTGLAPCDIRDRGGSVFVVHLFIARVMAAHAHQNPPGQNPPGRISDGGAGVYVSTHSSPAAYIPAAQPVEVAP
jgi:AraC-like DNA-binding protein